MASETVSGEMPPDPRKLQFAMFMGKFHIQAFMVVHDVPCCGFLIRHPEIGKFLYVTDTSYVPFRFMNVSTMLIEANWGEEYINRNEVKYLHSLQHHMSVETAIKCVVANISPDIVHVVLCHLSQGNSYPEKFKEAVKAVVPAWCTVDIAEPGLEVNVDNVPF